MATVSPCLDLLVRELRAARDGLQAAVTRKLGPAITWGYRRWPPGFKSVCQPVLSATVRTYAAAAIAQCRERRKTVRLPTGISTMSSSTTTITAGRPAAEAATFAILVALSFSHLLNDMMQSLLPAIYPLLKAKFALDFGQVGLITFTFQVTASLLQPVVGLYTDKRPMPFSLAVGMGFTLIGLLLLSGAASFVMLLTAAAMIGLGSSVFHPESSRVARMASGAGAAAGGLRRGAARPGQRGLVRAVRAAGDGRAAECRPLVSRRPPADRGAAPRGGSCRLDAVASARHGIDHHPAGADLLQVFLHGQPEHVLHVLPDP
jgi:hypothetical protein